MKTATFKRSIIHFASVYDIEMVLAELQSDLAQQVVELEVKVKQAKEEGDLESSISFNDEASPLIKVKIMLLDKKAEVRDHYENSKIKLCKQAK